MDNPQNELDQAHHDLQNHMEDQLKEDVKAEEFLDEIEEHRQKVEFLSVKLAIHEGEFDGPNAQEQLAEELATLRENGQISADQEAILMGYWEKNQIG